MNYRTKYFLVLLIVMWPVLSLFIYLIDDLITKGNLTGQTGSMRVLITAAVGLLLAFLSVLYSFIFNPITKAQVNIFTELENTGLSDSFINIAEAEVNRLIGTGKLYKFYRPFVQYTCLIANAYTNKGDIPTAMDKINAVTLSDMQTYLKNPEDNRLFLSYFDMQMDICEKINDAGRAENVMSIAAPYLEKCENSTITDKLLGYETFCLYQMTRNDIDKALEYANRCFSLGSTESITFVGYGLKSKCYIRAKQFDKALEAINKAESISRKGMYKQIAGTMRSNYEKALAAAGNS